MENRYKKVRNVITAKPTLEGAGVRINRVFGYFEKEMTDPFLMMDYFHSSNPDEYIKGFPWHPHRGIETITYLLSGAVEHSDSLGNKGVIKSGDVQWMTAGSGIIHQEMPLDTTEMFHGFQIWLNLPKVNKMVDPVYRGIESDSIPQVETKSAIVKIISGTYNETTGPAKGLFVKARLLDIDVKPGADLLINSEENETIIAFVFAGSGFFDEDGREIINAGQMVVLNNGADFYCKASIEGMRVLFLEGIPLNEPIAWRGPIVMNTSEEIQTAFFEYSNGSFIKTRQKIINLN